MIVHVVLLEVCEPGEGNGPAGEDGNACVSNVSKSHLALKQ